jgi:alpha-mannosidase
VHDDRRIIETRIRTLLDRVIRPALHSDVHPLTRLRLRLRPEAPPPVAGR